MVESVVGVDTVPTILPEEVVSGLTGVVLDVVSMNVEDELVTDSIDEVPLVDEGTEEVPEVVTIEEEEELETDPVDEVALVEEGTEEVSELTEERLVLV